MDFFISFRSLGSFPVRAWNGAFFVSSIDFSRLKSKRALSEAKKSIKQTKNASFHARSGNEPLRLVQKMMMMMIFYSCLVTIFKYMQCLLSKA